MCQLSVSIRIPEKQVQIPAKEYLDNRINDLANGSKGKQKKKKTKDNYFHAVLYWLPPEGVSR